jgi:hypothetical protein
MPAEVSGCIPLPPTSGGEGSKPKHHRESQGGKGGSSKTSQNIERGGGAPFKKGESEKLCSLNSTCRPIRKMQT